MVGLAVACMFIERVVKSCLAGHWTGCPDLYKWRKCLCKTRAPHLVPMFIYRLNPNRPSFASISLFFSLQ